MTAGWFDLAAFDPGPERGGAGVYLLDSVGSTSDFLLGRGDAAVGSLVVREGSQWREAASGELPPPDPGDPFHSAIARDQVGGRGRMGRRWLAGGLQMSWRSPVPKGEFPAGLAVWAGTVSALALADLSGVEIRVKWPNDLMLHGRKVGGMIFDLVGPADRLVLVGGLGLNLGPPPEGLARADQARAASLAEAPAGAPSTAAAAGAVLRAFDEGLPGFIAEGWVSHRAAFDRLDHLAGRRVVLLSGESRREGVARGLDDDGALLLDEGGIAPARILAGDVHILAADGTSAEHGEE